MLKPAITRDPALSKREDDPSDSNGQDKECLDQCSLLKLNCSDDDAGEASYVAQHSQAHFFHEVICWYLILDKDIFEALLFLADEASMGIRDYISTYHEEYEPAAANDH